MDFPSWSGWNLDLVNQLGPLKDRFSWNLLDLQRTVSTICLGGWLPHSPIEPIIPEMEKNRQGT